MKKLALGLLAVAGLFVVGCGVVAEYSYPQNPEEWTQEMRQAAPDKFAELAEKAVSANLKKIDDRLDAIRQAAGQLAKRHKASSEKYEFGRKLGKELVAAEKKGEFPVTILGVEYEKFQLESQKQVVAGELTVHSKIMREVKKTSETLEKEKRGLMLHRAECQGQLDMLQAQIEIWKTREITTDDLTLLGECADVLLGTGEYLAKLDPVADIETLMKRAEAEAENETAEFNLEAILDEFDESEAADVAESVSKVEDFGELDTALEGDEEAEAEVEGKGKGTDKLPSTLEEKDIPEEPAK